MTLFFKTGIVYVGLNADVHKFSVVNVLGGSKNKEMTVLEILARVMPLASSLIVSLPAVVSVSCFLLEEFTQKLTLILNPPKIASHIFVIFLHMYLFYFYI